ncbi:hypothetical protein [Nostoc parmelioides]|uniref:ATP-binding protein n=1 Tax=Nostoc parmelioides FACHB-3921 TaxID=2692909 RepID=A0ABR8BRF3_9NOSO|nr:hypothetical protein [Nostoc parmelioides]MBD2255518.1 hypothetical protein [Nostoc parmelioides FACHB-3921]
MDTKPSDLNQRSYNIPPRLNLLMMASVLGAVTCAIAAHVGDGIAKKELCFYPESARVYDAPIKALGDTEHLLLGNKYCRYEQRSQIPEPYLKANQYRTSNPNYNPWAFLQHDSLYVFRSLPADNPFKIHLGLGAMVLGGIGLWATSKARDYLSDIRPHYRATKQFEGVKANYSVKLGEQILEMSGNELLKCLRGIKIAEARQQFIASITPQQVTALLMAMSAEDYTEFGHLLDGGASFDKFEQPQLPHGQPGTVTELSQQPVIANADKYQWMKNAIGYPALLFGGMGSGKSWTTREIVWQKVNALWDVVALDPHGTEVEWRGVRLITGYREIADFMQWYMDEMRLRYAAYRESGMTEEQWTQHLRASGKQLSVICEEFTTWTDHIIEPMPLDAPENWKPDPDFIGKWFRCAMTESRKQLMIPLFVAHDRTMEILAKAKGLSKLRDAALLEIELIAQVDPITTEAKASGMGKIKLPGHGQWLPIELPKLDHKRIDFRFDNPVPQARENPNPPQLSTDHETAERIWQLEFNLDKPPIEISPTPSLIPLAQSLLQYLQRTERKSAVIQEIQPNFKVKGQRFSSEELKRLFNELVENSLAVWLDANTIEIAPNQTDGQNRQD